ncbi:MAG TPA: glycosyltransferase family 2 protein [Thermoanaerobaculia bacterium]|nr:glycosyltransferase family 2 protein [Thermoanaerobaculia bacterium]
MSAAPRLSVVMPVYNAGAFVDEAIASVLGQDFADFEFIIIDDGSTDGTPALLAAWSARDERIVLIRSERNEGIGAALRKGIAAARGELVALQDADDVSLPQRFSTQAAALDADRSLAMVVVSTDVVDAQGRRIGKARRTPSPEVAAYLLHFSNVLGGLGRAMLRRSALVAAGVGDTELAVDYDLWTRLSRFGGIRVLPFVGMRYRVHPGGVSVRLRDGQRRDIRAISGRMLRGLLQRELRDDELAAVASMWSMQPADDDPALAQQVLREAFARFSGPAQARLDVRREHARRWARGAVFLCSRLRIRMALRYLRFAIAWNVPHALRELATGLALAALRRANR